MGSSARRTRWPPAPYDGAPRTDATKPDGSQHGKKNMINLFIFFLANLSGI